MQACNRSSVLIESERSIDACLVGLPNSHKTSCHRSSIRPDPVQRFGRALAWSDYPTPTELLTSGRVPRYESYVTPLCHTPPSSLVGFEADVYSQKAKPNCVQEVGCLVLYVIPSRLCYESHVTSRLLVIVFSFKVG